MAKYSPLHEPLVSTYDDERKVEPAGGIQVAHVIDRGHESPAWGPDVGSWENLTAKYKTWLNGSEHRGVCPTGVSNPVPRR